MAQFSSPFGVGIGGRNVSSRRGSAVSFLLSSPSAGGGSVGTVANSLSPNSALPAGFNPQRRRNSYAAGVLPELHVNECKADGRMSPTKLAQQQQYHHGGMAQQQYGSQQHLLDPSAACHRRRLPPTPLDLVEGRLSGSNELICADAIERSGGHAEGITRRSSSPRVLPTPPTPQMQNFHAQWSPNGTAANDLATNITSSPMGRNDAMLSPSPNLGPFCRRPSSRRRRLPAEPVQQAQQNQRDQQGRRQQTTASFDGSLPPMAHTENQQQQKDAIGGGETAGGQLLLRSSSTRSARGQHGRSPAAGLPPVPRPQQSLETEHFDADSVELCRTASSLTNTAIAIGAFTNSVSNNTNGTHPSKVIREKEGTNAAESFGPSIRQTANEVASNSLSECLAISHQQKRDDRCDLTVPMATSALTPTAQKLSTVSAPTTPREMQQKEQKNSMALTNHSNSRKFSSDSPAVLSDLTAISSLNLQRNGSGSMAHLLEQQHILRREFTTTPNSEGTVSMADSAGGCARSNSSSLSPSIEQLNCTASVSRSGSDAEMVADPSVLGFDPSLYTSGPSPLLTLSSAGGSFSGPSSAAHSTTDQPSTSALPCDDQPRPRGLGLVHCTLQHFPVRKRLRVNVLKIEGLAGELRPDLDIQPFCKLLLTPGKKQQQQSVVKRGRDAVFNQEFFFDGVATEEIESKQLQIEVCHCSMQKLQKDQEIGEVRIPLKDITQQLYTKREVRIVEELKLFTAGRKLGKLHISTCIEREARRLTINLHKAEDLPKWGIIGAPDVQIRIRMQQANGTEALKCSRVLKNTTTAVYKEAVMFLISTSETDLAQTKIAISVHDLSRSVTGNDTIGSVFLGALAVDKSEQDQWRNTVEHWGKEFKGAHTLKNVQCQAAPEVHVVDVREEEEQSAD